MLASSTQEAGLLGAAALCQLAAAMEHLAAAEASDQTVAATQDTESSAAPAHKLEDVLELAVKLSQRLELTAAAGQQVAKTMRNSDSSDAAEGVQATAKQLAAAKARGQTAAAATGSGSLATQTGKADDTSQLEEQLSRELEDTAAVGPPMEDTMQSCSLPGTAQSNEDPAESSDRLDVAACDTEPPAHQASKPEGEVELAEQVPHQLKAAAGQPGADAAQDADVPGAAAYAAELSANGASELASAMGFADQFSHPLGAASAGAAGQPGVHTAQNCKLPGAAAYAAASAANKANKLANTLELAEQCPHHPELTSAAATQQPGADTLRDSDNASAIQCSIQQSANEASQVRGTPKQARRAAQPADAGAAAFTQDTHLPSTNVSVLLTSHMHRTSTAHWLCSEQAACCPFTSRLVVAVSSRVAYRQWCSSVVLTHC